MKTRSLFFLAAASSPVSSPLRYLEVRTSVK